MKSVYFFLNLRHYVYTNVPWIVAGSLMICLKCFQNYVFTAGEYLWRTKSQQRFKIQNEKRREEENKQTNEHTHKWWIEKIKQDFVYRQTEEHTKNSAIYYFPTAFGRLIEMKRRGRTVCFGVLRRAELRKLHNPTNRRNTQSPTFSANKEINSSNYLFLMLCSIPHSEFSSKFSEIFYLKSPDWDVLAD